MPDVHNKVDRILDEADANRKKDKRGNLIYDKNERVEFQISYPAGYPKKKYYQEGEKIVLHPIHARSFVNSGIGHVTKMLQGFQ